MEKIATRGAYGKTLAALGETHPEIVVLDSDLAAATMSRLFGEKFPDRFFNCGIAEANMTGIAAGLATCGYVPFTNSFAMFAVGRAFEQIRNSVAYPHLNVKIVGSHGGASVGEDGATHQCNEDLALMRVLPGMLVVNPCDGYEMEQCVKALVEYEGPCYLRMCRYAMPVITDTLPGYHFALGKGVTLREGADLTIIGNGLPVHYCLQAADLLAQEGISARVIDMHTLKPLDEALVVKAAQETGAILTVEEHNVIGGLGSAVAECLSEQCPVPLLRHGIPDEFGRSGTAAAVLEYFGLTPEAIAEKAKDVLKKKR